MTYNRNSSFAGPGNMPTPVINEESSESFWERRYASLSEPSGGRPSTVLVRFVAHRNPGTALELGCARGDDAIWLAKQGWIVTGVDVSETALRAARTAAEKAGVGDRTSFVRHDLGTSSPNGIYDLVTAMFLHSPVEFDRAYALRRAARSVASGGLLLIAAHGSRAPWSWAAPDTVYPTAQYALAELGLELNNWRKVFVGPITRTATGPNAQHATVIDNVVALERR